MLLVDHFSGHMTSKVRDEIQQCGTILEFVPPSYTSKLQVMDVSVNKPFKDRVRDQYDMWYVCEQEREGVALPRPDRKSVSCWIHEAWQDITVSIVTNGWRQCGFPEFLAGKEAHNNSNKENISMSKLNRDTATAPAADDESNDDNDDDVLLFPEVAGLTIAPQEEGERGQHDCSAI
ncbi:hypothetical protein ACA910_011568 [Epithemia clementina (nom. ined.)]